MGEKKKERAREIEHALKRADELDRLDDDRDFDAEAKRMEAAMKKAREKKKGKKEKPKA